MMISPPGNEYTGVAVADWFFPHGHIVGLRIPGTWACATFDPMPRTMDHFDPILSSSRAKKILN
jgi:hypothetical protein